VKQTKENCAVYEKFKITFKIALCATPKAETTTTSAGFSMAAMARAANSNFSHNFRMLMI